MISKLLLMNCRKEFRKKLVILKFLYKNGCLVLIFCLYIIQNDLLIKEQSTNKEKDLMLMYKEKETIKKSKIIIKSQSVKKCRMEKTQEEDNYCNLS